MMRFQVSPIYEMLISLQVLLNPKPGRHADWAASVQADLPRGFMDELRAICEPFKGGSIFFELPVDYPNHADVPGFFDYVRDMEPMTFVFYLTGRILTPDEIIATNLDHAAIVEAIMATSYGPTCGCMEPAFDEVILRDVPAFQRRLADFWERYWNKFFQYHLAEFRPHWENAIDEKTMLLNRLGGQDFYERVAAHKAMKGLPTLPPDHPVTDIVFIPVYLLPTAVYMIYGYGNITVLFDSERTEARLAEIERHKEQLLTTFKALSDNSRLDILKLIAHYGGAMNGKKIAAHLELSAPTVSRHLTQLRDAGLITEESQDNRTITYRLQNDALQMLSKSLLDYLNQ
jgi:DNA-binding transcriptional ArsR family regulator